MRNTPTDVGKTDEFKFLKPITRKHPHGRGEDQKAMKEVVETEETPPRTWGRRKNATASHDSIRNTPTDVGKTLGNNQQH